MKIIGINPGFYIGGKGGPVLKHLWSREPEIFLIGWKIITSQTQTNLKNKILVNQGSET